MPLNQTKPNQTIKVIIVYKGLVAWNNIIAWNTWNYLIVWKLSINNWYNWKGGISCEQIIIIIK